MEQPEERLEDRIITITPKAVEKFKRAADTEQRPYELRIGIRGGGCNGFQYALDFKEDQKEGDAIIEQDGLKIFVDPVSAMYLEGTIIDYISLAMAGEGFKFINPNVKHTCGCGSSFSTE